MNKLLAFLLVITMTGLVACSDVDESTQEGAGDRLSGESYSGVIPCADCAGILYEVSLDKDNSYKASSTYIGESARPFIERGNWEIKNDTLLILKDSSDTDRALVIGDSTLAMLDGDQNYVTGPLADHFVLTKGAAQPEAGSNRWSDLREKGIDFRASGNEPFWDAAIDFDKNITFKLLDGDSVTFAVPEMQQDTASKARTFTADTESGPIALKLYPTGCIDDMSGEFFSHGVNVAYGDKTYRGCGNFINDEYKLQDFWKLHTLKGSEVSPDSLAKAPGLHFNLQENRVSGNSGCNQLTGSLDLEGDSLSFGQLASTRMACQGSMEFENNFLQALDKVKSYEISNGELILRGKEEVLMVLYRAE